MILPSRLSFFWKWMGIIIILFAETTGSFQKWKSRSENRFPYLEMKQTRRSHSLQGAPRIRWFADSQTAIDMVSKSFSLVRQNLIWLSCDFYLDFIHVYGVPAGEIIPTTSPSGGRFKHFLLRYSLSLIRWYLPFPSSPRYKQIYHSSLRGW